MENNKWKMKYKRFEDLPSVICHLLFVICYLLFTSSAVASVNWTETQKSDWSDGLITKTTWYPETQLQLDWFESNLGVSSPTAGAGWFDNNWKYRRKISIYNSTKTLTDYQIWIPTTTFGNEWKDIRSKAQSDLDDIRFTDSGGNLLDYWIEYSTSGFWVKISTLYPNGTTDIYMYYGNPDAAAGADKVLTFSYDTLQDLYCVNFGPAGGNDVGVVSYIDGNVISDGTSQLDLDKQKFAKFSGTEISTETKISAKGPISAQAYGNCCDSIFPISFAGTKFSYPISRSGSKDDVWTIWSPFGDANIEIYENDNLTPLLTSTVLKGEVKTFKVNVSSVGIVESDIPVVVGYQYGYSSDSTVLYPASTELFGINYGYGGNWDGAGITAFEDNTFVEVWTSTGYYISKTINRGEMWIPISWNSSDNGQGKSPACRVRASKPVVCISQGDGDGGESISFLPLKELDTEYIIPTPSQYIAVCAPYANTTVELYDSNNNFLESGTATGGPDPYPYKLLFSAGYSTGTRVIANKPIFIYAETTSADTSGDESNIIGWKQARKYFYPEPTISSIGSEEGKYYSSGNYKSNVLDTGAEGTKIIEVSWNPTTQPAGTDIQVSVRASNTVFGANDETPSWVSVTNGGNPSVTGRYIQWMSTFTTTNSTTTPVLQDITITYVSPPKSPQINYVSATYNSITWGWIDNSNGQYEEDGFRVISSTGGVLVELSQGTTYWIETGLNPNTLYTRYIQAYNVAGSSNSATKTKWTLPAIWQENSVVRTGNFSFCADSNSDWTWQVPVKGGSSVQVNVYMKYNSSYGSSQKPRIILSNLGVNSSAQMSAGPDTWEKLTVSGTPSRDGILFLRVTTFSTNPDARVYIDDVEVVQ